MIKFRISAIWFSVLFAYAVAQTAGPTNLTASNITSTSATLSWAKVTGATSYNLQVFTYSSENNPITIVNISTLTTSYPVTGLYPISEYHWQVSATISGVVSTWSSSTFQTPCDIPVITIQPHDVAVTIPDSATFAIAVTPSAYMSYQWERSNDGGVTWNNIQNGFDETTCTIGTISVNDNGAQFRCKVTSFNSCTTTTSNAAILTVVSLATLPAPTLISPANGGSTESFAAFSWNAVTNASSYSLQVNTTPIFTAPIINVPSITATSYGVSGLVPDTWYYWRVNAKNASVTSTWSVTDSFICQPYLKVITPKRFSVSLQNWATPNIMSYTLPTSCHVDIKVYDVQGRLLKSIVDKTQGEGSYSCPITGLTSKAYLLSFKAGNYQDSKLILTTQAR